MHFMVNKSLANTPKNIGLSDKETKIYLACLELGSSVVAAISKRSGVSRVTCYDILEKLIHKGFINFLNKNDVRYFSATEPESILSEVQRNVHDFKNILPDLKRMRGDSVHPKIQYFEGAEGIKAIYEDTLTSKTEILNYANSHEIRSFWPQYDEEYVAKRVKKKIHLKGIAPMDEWGQEVQKESKRFHREIRLVPIDQYNFSNEINIYDNKVAIASFKDELIGMIIESTEIANTQRAIFNMAWEFAAKFVSRS
jgi:sugar-specific transcriptional regulator TrmB